MGTNCVQECAQTKSQSSTGGVSSCAAVIRRLLIISTSRCGGKLSPSHKDSLAKRAADAIMVLFRGDGQSSVRCEEQ